MDKHQNYMNSTNNQTIRLLTAFNLAGIKKHLATRLTEAQERSLSYSEFLELLLTDEQLNREDNRTRRRFREARFPYEKHLDEFLQYSKALLQRDAG